MDKRLLNFCPWIVFRKIENKKEKDLKFTRMQGKNSKLSFIAVTYSTIVNWDFVSAIVVKTCHFIILFVITRYRNDYEFNLLLITRANYKIVLATCAVGKFYRPVAVNGSFFSHSLVKLTLVLNRFRLLYSSDHHPTTYWLS